MKRLVLSGLLVCGALVLMAGNTHRWLPAEYDPCQQDMTHEGHVAELPMFHCIGHTEYEVGPGQKGLDAVREWNHVHPWMDINWHLAQGFDRERARMLLATEEE